MINSTVSSPYVGSGLTTISGTNGSIGSTLSWSNPMYHDLVISASTEEVSALHVRGAIKMQNGDILDERLERIETLLNIPVRNIDMEEEFPKLRELWNEYHAELEKYKTWKKLKDSK